MACSRSRFFTHWIPRFWKLSSPGHQSHCLQQRLGPPASPSLPLPPLPPDQTTTPCLTLLNGFPLHCNETHSLLWLTRPSACDLALATIPAGSFPNHRGFSSVLQHTTLIPTPRPLHLFTLLKTFRPRFPTYSFSPCILPGRGLPRPPSAK